jgi:calcium-dependent protein kinase
MPSHFNCDLQALASTLEPEEIRDLRDQFDAMDVDRNGTITLEEIRHVRLNALAFLYSVLFNLEWFFTFGRIHQFCLPFMLMFGPGAKQALQKDRPWAVRESRVLEILQAVWNCASFYNFVQLELCLYLFTSSSWQ